VPPPTATVPAVLLRPAAAPGGAGTRADATTPGGPAPEALCLPSPDWLKHLLAVSGPAADLAAFQATAAGPGIIPWRQAAADLAEGWFNRIVAVPVPRTISVAGAHTLADRLRDAVEAWAVADTHAALDLHALIPVPADLLARGPDDPTVIAWLWAHWGTTWPLRHVTRRSDPPAGQGGERLVFRFHAADWSPWPALCAIRDHWPVLRFALQPEYEMPSATEPAPGPTRQHRTTKPASQA